MSMQAPQQDPGAFDPRAPASLPSTYNNKDLMNGLKKSTYMQELQNQMRDNQERKYNRLQNDREHDHSLLRQRLDNDPFGKQGAGAPLRDRYGNIITTKTKVLHSLYDHAPSLSYGGPAPAFSLKARLARDNLLTQSLDSLPSRRAMSYGEAAPSMHQNGYYPPPSSHFGMQSQVYQQQQPLYQNPSMYAQNPYAMQQPMQDYGMGGSAVFNPSMTRNFRNEVEGYPARHVSAERNMPYPVFDEANAKDAKLKKMHAHIELQNDLLKQMEHRKMQKEADGLKKKLQDELEDVRIRRENDEMKRKDDDEATRKKDMFDRLQKENEKLSAHFVVSKKKFNPKRPRTPIEEVEERIRLENLSKLGITIKSDAQSAAATETDRDYVRNYPLGVAQHVELAVENQVLGLKKNWDVQQHVLADQLLEIKRKLLQINRDRIRSSNEVDDLKYLLRKQHITDEMRRTEIYNALLKSQQMPSILPTVTRIALDRESNPEFEFPKGYGLYGREMDVIDALLANKSNHLNKQGFSEEGGLAPKFDAPYPETSAFDSGVKYLSYFNNSDTHNGIDINDIGDKYDLPEEVKRIPMRESYIQVPDEDSAKDLLRRNKERLDVLEDLEWKGLTRYGGDSPLGLTKKDTPNFDDEMVQMLKSESVEDDLLDKINDPRKYLPY